MPVAVHVPTRIRTDLPSLTGRQDAIAEAVGAALERALRHSGDVVLAPRGEHVDLRLGGPEFFWWGTGVHQVGPEGRSALEAAVSQAVVAAVARANLRRPASRTSGRLTAAVSEPARSDRYDQEVGSYAVPSYDVSTPKTRLPVKSARATQVGQATGVSPVWPALTDDVAIPIFVRILERRGGLPTSGFRGAIFNRAPQGGFSGGMYIVVFRFPEGKVAFETATGQLSWVDKGKDPGTVDVVSGGLPESAMYSVEKYRSPTGKTDRASLLAEYFRPDVEGRLKKGRYESNAEFSSRTERTLQAAVAKLPKPDPELTDFIELFFPGGSLLVPVRPLTEDFDAVELIPIGPSAVGLELGAGGAGAEGPGGVGVGARAKQEGAAAEGGAAEGGTAAAVIEGMEGEGLAQLVFPRAPEGAETLALECGPLNGEPSLDQLGEDGVAIRRVIQQIAFRLQIDADCPFAGQFAVNAAQVLGERAKAIATWSGPVRPSQATPGKEGNLGTVHFVPPASPQVLFLRHLAATTPYISALRDLVSEAIQRHGGLIEGTWHDDPWGWILHFDEELTPAMGAGVGALFAMTCQVLFLQLLASSRQAIQKRLDSIDAYSANFGKYVLPLLERIEDLTRLREAIEQAKALDEILAANRAWARGYTPGAAAAPDRPPSPAEAPAQSWEDARKRVTDSLSPQAAAAPVGGQPYQVFKDGDTYRVRDTKGRLWDLTSLENVTIMTRGTIESIEPLAKQFFDLPQVMERIRNPQIGLKSELLSILWEMMDHNLKITAEAEASLDYGFKASKISEDIPHATVQGTSYSLTGIHKLAHEQIGEFFQGDRYYGVGIDHLFSAALGLQELKSFIIFTGLVLLAVLCPEAAIVIGIVVAAEQYGEAAERKEIYQSLINPDLVLTAAEVEADLFAAKLGLVLAFLPVFGKVAGEANAALKLLARGGAEAAEAGAATAGRVAAAEAASLMTREIAKGVVEKFAIEFVKAEVVNSVLSHALGAIVQEVVKRRELTGPIGGLEGAMAALVRREQARRPKR